VETALYDSADKIEKAGVTKNNQLSIFFEKNLTNSEQSHFSLVIPLAQFQTNAVYFEMNLGLGGNSIFPWHTEKLPPSFKHATYWTLNVPDGNIQPNWKLLKNPKSNLNFVPIEETLTTTGSAWPGLGNFTALHDENFILRSNATQTVYLTRKKPIEFVYVDASIKRPYTIVKVAPTVVSHKHTDHPADYALLPLTIPTDIILSPFELWIYLEFTSGNWKM
jgi:hypothetical protein